MQPWMVIALLLVAGALLLLVAPRLHRASIRRARRRLEGARSRRIATLRARPGTGEVRLEDRERATRVRDRLLLQGIRIEIVESPDGVWVVHEAGLAEAVAAVVAELTKVDELTADDDERL